jgi:hypothetical protein
LAFLGRLATEWATEFLFVHRPRGRCQRVFLRARRGVDQAEDVDLRQRERNRLLRKEVVPLVVALLRAAGASV